MVTGFHIFIHSVQMILRNRADVFRLAALPFVVALGALLALGTLGSAAKSGGMPNPGAALVFLPLLFIAGACALWFIVNWHRFILLEEYPPGWMPKFRGDRVLSYLGHSLLLVIVTLCCQRRRKNLPLGRSKSRPLGVAPWSVMPSNSKQVPRRVGRQANLMC